MAKRSGVGTTRLYVAGIDISPGVSVIRTLAGGPAVFDATPVTANGWRRAGAKLSGTVAVTTYFDPSTGTPGLAPSPTLAPSLTLAPSAGTTGVGAFATWSPLPTADVVLTVLLGTDTALPAAGMVAKQVDYAGTRGRDGSLAFDVDALSTGCALEWGRTYVGGAARTDLGPTAGAGVDDLALTAQGLTAYLHCFAVTGTATVALQHSTDNGVGDPFADVPGAVFAAVASAPSAQRVATAATQPVKRWLRVTTSGAFSALAFFVMALRWTVT